MAAPFTNVNPGDVITSDLMNFILTKLQEYDSRIGKLESGTSAGQVHVTSFDPANQQNAGRNLTIFGAGFAVPAETNNITLNQVKITNFTSPNSDTVLNFIIPNDFIPPADNLVTVSIGNSQGSTSVLYKVLPFVAVPGPDPVIQGVAPVAPATAILVNAPIHITGANFAPTGSANQILFDIVLGPNTVTYPRPGNTLVFDDAHSGVNDIIVTLPDIVEINLPGPAGQRTVTLRLTVGAHPEQRFQFAARRS
jgi:hypothetical protein